MKVSARRALPAVGAPLKVTMSHPKALLVLLLSVALAGCWSKSLEPIDVGAEEDISFWHNEGRQTLQDKITFFKEQYAGSPYIKKKAKNVIFFIGDGMGMTTITAARIYKGQKDGLAKDAERGFLAFETLPFAALAKVFATDYQVADSACSATAYLTGVKANKGTAGVSAKVGRKDCAASLDPETWPDSIIKWAQDEGKHTGFVTTTRVTHGTEAPLYSHTAERDWEAYTDDTNCTDITTQLVKNKPGKDIRVILGGGRRGFQPTSKSGGYRKDGVNLIEEWKRDKVSRQFNYSYVKTWKDLNDTDLQATDFLLGLFAKSHLPDSLDEDPNIPPLYDMVIKALTVLQKSEKGYLLFVEGGKIDINHHQNRAYRALEETYQFDKAIAEAIKRTNPEDTLIVVSADHSHTLTINGYPERGNDILGMAGVDDDNLNFTTLMYGNGPGNHQNRTELTTEDVTDKDYRQYSGVFFDGCEVTGGCGRAHHGGEDVPVYARGPGAYIFSGVFDQTFIAHGISYAACIGPHRDICPTSAAPRASFSIEFLLILAFYALYIYIF